MEVQRKFQFSEGRTSLDDRIDNKRNIARNRKNLAQLGRLDSEQKTTLFPVESEQDP